MRPSLLFAHVVLVLSVLWPSQTAHAQLIDDLLIRYSGMRISEAVLRTSDRVDVEFYRHSVGMAAGRGPLELGFIMQATYPGDGAPDGPSAEEGIMLTAGYSQALTPRVRAEVSGRIGLTGSNEAQPLYAEDTDVRLNLVAYSLDGAWLLGGDPVFPSAYVGSILNRYGRVQGIGGTGAWWRSVGAYLTVFQALNGVEDPAAPGEDADVLFAAIQNGGVSLSGSYEFRNFLVTVRRNWPLQNGGNDFALALEYRFFDR